MDASRAATEEAATPHLFVYGTLRSDADAPGGVSEMLREEARRVGPAEIRARLYGAGWYPAAVPAEDGRVRGEVYRLEEPARALPALDRYEGCAPEGEGLFRRERVPVELEDGEVLEAWVYFYDRDTSDLEEIESGDFLAARREPGDGKEDG